MTTGEDLHILIQSYTVFFFNSELKLSNISPNDTVSAFFLSDLISLYCTISSGFE